MSSEVVYGTAPMAAGHGVSLVMLVVEIGREHVINPLQRSQLHPLWLPLDVIPPKQTLRLRHLL